MLVGVIIAKTWDDVHQQAQALPDDIGMVELRLDAFDPLDVDELVAQCQAITRPIIMTYRRVTEGGWYVGDESGRLKTLLACLAANPTYVDIEHDIDTAWFDCIQSQFPKISIIRSYHHMTNTPEDLQSVINDLYHSRVSMYKVVTTAQSSLDAISFLRTMQQQCIPWCGHCMGEEGQFTRFLSPVVGGLWSYVNVSQDDGGVGLPCINQYRQYRHEALNADTAIYGLIGDPVNHSKGVHFHNAIFSKDNRNAVYINIRCTQDQLQRLFDGLRFLPIHGMSVTMPLKTAVVSQRLCQTSLTSVNTLKRVDSHWEAINTDGDGLCDALQAHVSLQQQRVLLLGAGGAAHGIAAALLNNQAKVMMANRSLSSLQSLIQQYPLSVMPWEAIDLTNIDMIISALPAVAYQDLKWFDTWSDQVQSHHVIVDVNYGQGTTPLQLHAARVGATYVGGDAMFSCQAFRQQRYWLHQ